MPSDLCMVLLFFFVSSEAVESTACFRLETWVVISGMIIRMQRVRITTIWIALSTYLPLGLGGMEQAVLCFGADGHVTVEAALNGRCSDFLEVSSQTAHQSTLITSRASTMDHCGTCIDIPILISSLNEHFAPIRNNSSQKQIKVLADFACAVPKFTKILTEDFPHFPPSAVNLTLISLSAVNLLI